jgi:hypothetical protein
MPYRIHDDVECLRSWCKPGDICCYSRRNDNRARSASGRHDLHKLGI